MSIATRTGDDGNTGLFGGARVPKDHLRVQACGSVDELNAHLALVLASDAELTERKLLIRIQNDLFALAAELATPRVDNPLAERVQPFPLKSLEDIDAALMRIEDALPPLTNFILPGGSATAARLHIARAVCRRAERHVVTLARKEAVTGTLLRYLNRLSDLLFLLARTECLRAGVPETTWQQEAP
jgi:cob(I)alamin adenosyltransferase